MSAPASTAARPSFRRRHWGKLLVAALVLIPALVFAVWSAVGLAFSYSDGTRAGYALKLSRRGWLCKTWEGELAMSAVPGQMPQTFRYTVRDDAVAREIQRYEGQQVALTYEQHPFLPNNCFGDTEYFVTEVRGIPTTPVGVPQAVPAGASAAAAPAAGAPAATAPGAKAPAPAPTTTAPAAPTPASPAPSGAGGSAGAVPPAPATPAAPPAPPPAPPRAAGARPTAR